MQEGKSSSLEGIVLPPGPPDPAKFQEIFEKYGQETVELPKGVERIQEDE